MLCLFLLAFFPSAFGSIPPGPGPAAPPPPSARYPLAELVSFPAENTQRTSVTLLVLFTNPFFGIPWLTTDNVTFFVTEEHNFLSASGYYSVGGVTPGGTSPEPLYITLSANYGSLSYDDWLTRVNDMCGFSFFANYYYAGSASVVNPYYVGVTLVLRGWWSYASGLAPNSALCEGNQCVSPCQISKNVRAAMTSNGNSNLGWGMFYGRYPQFYFGGNAQRAPDTNTIPWTADTKMHAASVSKLITALTCVRLLSNKGIPVTTPIGSYLPAGWIVSNYVKTITFQDLMAHRSGIKHYGNGDNSYSTIKAFFTQPVASPPSSVNTTCQPSNVSVVPNPINPNDKSGCYSNYNFAILRILIALLDGSPDTSVSNDAAMSGSTSGAYKIAVTSYVHGPLGLQNMDTAPPSNPNEAAFGYQEPATTNGMQVGNLTLSAGAYGWFFTIPEISLIVMSVMSQDGKIVDSTLYNIMMNSTYPQGWDFATSVEAEKNGGWSDGAGNALGASVMIAGPTIPHAIPMATGTMFINSNITQGGGAESILENAYAAALEYNCENALDCDSCTSNVNCGWCAATNKCTFGKSWGPNRGACSLWVFSATYCAAPCSMYGTCDTCTPVTPCGWCPSTRTCLTGTSSGPTNGVCPSPGVWTWTSSSCDVCNTHTTCYSCAVSAGCGWCPSAQGCFHGSSIGPSSGTCSGPGTWAWLYTACDACNDYTDCNSCTHQAVCGWCPSLHGCYTGTYLGPNGGSCPAPDAWAWSYLNCDSCNSNTKCTPCTWQSGCGWCRDRNVCVSGTASNSTVGVCSGPWNFASHATCNT